MPKPIPELIAPILASSHLNEADKASINLELSLVDQSEQDKATKIREILHTALGQAAPGSANGAIIYEAAQNLVLEYPLNKLDENAH